MSQFFALGGLFLGIDCAKGGRMDTCICMAESLGCSPETITTLLIGCTPVQNTKRKKNYRKISAISATIWKPNNTPPTNPWVKEEIKRDNRKYFG